MVRTVRGTKSLDTQLSVGLKSDGMTGQMTGHLEVDTLWATVRLLSSCDGHTTGHWPVALFKRRDRRRNRFWRKNQVSCWSAKVHPEWIKLSTAGKMNWTETELLSLKRSTVDKKCATMQIRGRLSVSSSTPVIPSLFRPTLHLFAPPTNPACAPRAENSFYTFGEKMVGVSNVCTNIRV